MPKYVAAIDQGTTSTRFIVFNHAGNVVAVEQKEHQQIYPKPGWVEHDPLEIWARTREVIQGVILKDEIDPKEIAAIGVTNQRETTVVWDKSTGQPVYNAIVWQDTRTDEICNELAKGGRQERAVSQFGGGGEDERDRAVVAVQSVGEDEAGLRVVRIYDGCQAQAVFGVGDVCDPFARNRYKPGDERQGHCTLTTECSCK